MQASKPINRILAILIALAGMWLLACAGVLILGRVDHWWFVGIGNSYARLQQIVGSYLAWTGAQLPSAAFAGLIIGSSSFSHPLRVTFLTVLTYHLFFIAIYLPHLGWTDIQGSEQFTLILAHLASTLLLVGASVIVAWLMPMWHKVFERYFRH